MEHYTFRKRTFLNPVSAGAESYISVLTESSVNGTYALGNYIVTIADCHRIIQLEFPLGDAQRRRQSLRKIDLLLEVLTAFRSALNAEAKLIDGKR